MKKNKTIELREGEKILYEEGDIVLIHDKRGGNLFILDMKTGRRIGRKRVESWMLRKDGNVRKNMVSKILKDFEEKIGLAVAGIMGQGIVG